MQCVAQRTLVYPLLDSFVEFSKLNLILVSLVLYVNTTRIDKQQAE